MEITKENFAEQFDNIVKDIKKSCFIGFDAEFTALLTSEPFKYRLFDTNKDRYDRLKSEVSNIIMPQIGLSMFQYNRDNDIYVAATYTFHLCPQVFGNIDQTFIFQGSTLKFLCKHKFDFNKFIYKGIPYLSKVEAEQIVKDLQDTSLYNNLSTVLEMDEEKELQKYCSEVSKWVIDKEEDTFYIDIQNPIIRYFFHNEVRLRYPNVLTTDSLGNSNKVLIYRDKDVDGANSAPLSVLKENLMNDLLGFSKVITLLENSKKPIVGHNIFMDMILLHNQFIGPLPDKYTTFKRNVHKVFPQIFDTKYISHEMSKKLTYNEVWRTNTLQDLYEFFSEGKSKKLQKGANSIKPAIPFSVNYTYHQAGWDSYCSAYCFTRLSQWAACEARGCYRSLGPSEILAAIQPLANRVNVIRASILYLDFANEDPPRQRPELLHIKALNERVINIAKVASVLASSGSVDVKPYGTCTALIATNSKVTLDRILKQFKDSRDYKVSVYNVYRHSIVARMAMWSGTLITGTLVLFLLHRKLRD